ncbi:TadA family conjugal transfer-associated ATPase [Naumannella sp. ID2617S]|nr:TadA family conjugal transfer-associated ATPase [Naumannella sp. ID2617S]
MSPEELELVRTELVRLGRSPLPPDVAAVMHRLGLPVSDAALVDTVAALRRDAVGAGRLEPLLRLPGVTDVLVNGAGQVFIDRGEGLELTEVRFDGEDEVRRLAARMAAAVGRRLDDGVPFVDARMADGTRLHAVLAPLAHPGTCLSLRVPAGRRFRLADWVAAGSIPAAGAEVLAGLVRARVAFLVSGGTGTGKTTLLASMLAEVPADERLLVVEDSRELQPDHPHCVRLEARAPNAEGAGAIPLSDLVRQALRMRPDRIVLGEVRGAELCDLLTALNTGHEGGCGTVHANSASDVPARLAALAALGGMGAEALRAQAAAALDVVVHVLRERGAAGRPGRRRVATIQVLQGDGQGLRMLPALDFTPDGELRAGRGFSALQELCAR